MARWSTPVTLFCLLICSGLIRQNQADSCDVRKVNSSEPITIQRYTEDNDVCWKVSATDDSYRVRVNFSHFSLNEGYDYLEIGDMWNDSIQSDSLLAKFSGRVTPNDVISLSKGLWIKLLVREGLDQCHARNLSFNLIAEEREVDISLPCPNSSKIKHPNHNGNYSNNEYRLWWIRTTPPCTITAKPERFWTQESSDFVFLGQHINGPFNREDWFNLTARREQWYLSRKVYRSNGTDLVIVFTSNFHGRKSGFMFSISTNWADGITVTNGSTMPTKEHSTQTKDSHSTSVVTTTVSSVFSPQLLKYEPKFYVIVTGLTAIAVAFLLILLVTVCRCYKSISKKPPNQTNYRDSWNLHFPIARSASTVSSLGRFISYFRYPDGSFSESFSSSTPSSSTFSSGRFSFSSSLYSDYTSLSSSYRSSVYSRIRRIFSFHQSEDELPVVQGRSSGNLLTTFHPQSSEDTSVDSPSEETSVQSEDQQTCRRISWRTIRNAFHNGLIRSRPGSFLSTSSVRERGDRTNTYSSIHDTDSLVLSEASVSRDHNSVFAIPSTRMKVKHTYFKGCKVEYDPVSQTVNSDASLTIRGTESDASRDQHVVLPEQHDAADWAKIKRKITHIYFRGHDRLSSCSSILGKPLPTIPNGHREDDTESLLDNFHPSPSCSPAVDPDVILSSQSSPTRTDGSTEGQWYLHERDDTNPFGHGTNESLTDMSGTHGSNLGHRASYISQAEVACATATDTVRDNRESLCGGQLNVGKSDIENQERLRQLAPEDNEATGGAAAFLGNKHLYSEIKKRKIIHTYFRGYPES